MQQTRTNNTSAMQPSSFTDPKPSTTPHPLLIFPKVKSHPLLIPKRISPPHIHLPSLPLYLPTLPFTQSNTAFCPCTTGYSVSSKMVIDRASSPFAANWPTKDSMAGVSEAGLLGGAISLVWYLVSEAYDRYWNGRLGLLVTE